MGSHIVKNNWNLPVSSVWTISIIRYKISLVFDYIRPITTAKGKCGHGLSDNRKYTVYRYFRIPVIPSALCRGILGTPLPPINATDGRVFSDVFTGSVARHDAPFAHGFAFGVLAHVRGRGHGVHRRGCYDVVSPSSTAAATAATPTAGSAVPDRTDPSLHATATAPPHLRASARYELPVAPRPEPGRCVPAVTVTRFRQDFVLGLKTHRRQDYSS